MRTKRLLSMMKQTNKFLLLSFFLSFWGVKLMAQSCPDEHHPHMIDLGLPSGTKWACCNVGATTPEGYGGQYAWGETEEKEYYDWSTYQFPDITGWEISEELGDDISGTKYDIAHVKWGGDWRMPSKEAFDELQANCTISEKQLNGVNGWECTGSNGNTIFFPSAGWKYESTLSGQGSQLGSYHSSTIYEDRNAVWNFRLDEIWGVIWSHDSGCYGSSVRPVTTTSSTTGNIEFADANVKAICVANWDTNGDEELSYEEAAAVTDLGQVFAYNSEITSFDELQYFMGLTEISENAFMLCESLTSVIIPISVTNIGAYAFSHSGLCSITIPKSITSIGRSVFWACESLSSIVVESGNTVYDSRDNCNAIIITALNELIHGCNNSVIPNTVTSIGDQAFNGRTGLTSIDIPNSVITIGNAVFNQCFGLTSVTIPNSVTSIGNYAFSTCGLTSVTIPNSVTSIGYEAFSGCSGLTSVTIPNSVTSIGTEAFSACSGLTSIKVESGNPNYDSRNDCNAIIETSSNTLIAGCKNTIIPNSVTSIGEGAFAWCYGLTSVTIPNSVTSISNYAFRCCSGLTSMTIPNSVTSIGQRAFESCDGLTSVTIPNSVTSIGDNAFWCSGLTEVSVDLATPLAINSFCFSNRANTTLYVPAGSKAAYEAADYWKEFKEIIEKEASKVKLSKTKAIIEKGKTLTLKSKVYPTTEDQSVTWKSSDKNVATVTKAGKVKAVGVGTAKITCTSVATGAKATCKVTVGYVKLSKTEVTIEKGKTLTLKSKVYPTTEDQSVTWESSDPTIVKVTASGKIGGLKAGTATITCTSVATGLSATCEVTVGYVKLSKTEVTIQKGKSLTLKCKVYPTTLDQSVTWESSDPTIVKVTSSGKIGGFKVGTATITCTSVATGLSATCIVTVTAAAAARSLNGEVTGIDDMDVDPAAVEPFDVYDLNGRKVLHQVTSLDALPDGVYIVNGRKVMKKD